MRYLWVLAVIAVVGGGFWLRSSRRSDGPPPPPRALVHRYLEAWSTHRFEKVWGFLSEDARAAWRKGDADPRARFLADAAWRADAWPTPVPAPHEPVSVEGYRDEWWFSFKRLDLVVILRHQTEGWRVEGHQVGRSIFLPASLIRSPDEDERERWAARLPRVCGGAYEDGGCVTERYRRVFVDPHGARWLLGERIGREALLEEMFKEGELRKNLDDPAWPTRVWAILFLDRDVSLRVLRDLLLDLTEPALAYRRFLVPLDFAKGGGLEYRDACGVLLDVESVADPAKVEVTMPEHEIVLRAARECGSGGDLGDALAGAKSVRVRCGPQVHVERLLAVLFLLGQVEGLQVTLDLCEPEVPETRWAMELDGKPVRTLTFPEKGDPSISLRLLRRFQ